jgi:tetratricopeptide (TPR) repeat protein
MKKTLKSENSILSKKLIQAYSLRDKGDIAFSQKIFLDLVISLSYPLYGTAEEKFLSSSNQFNLDDAILFILLDFSFMRSKLETEKAITFLEEFEKLLLSNNILPIDRFYFEKGVSYGSAGFYAKAFDCFVKLNINDRDDGFYFSAKLNLILCLEALGLPYQDYLKDFNRSYDKLLTQNKVSSPIQSQFQALKIRDKFFKKSSVDNLHFESGPLTGQALYLMVWIRKIPWLKMQESSLENVVSEFMTTGKHYLNSYRLNTFKELLLKSELIDEIKLEAHIERFYLWTWNFLINPSKDRLKKTLKLYDFFKEETGS